MTALALALLLAQAPYRLADINAEPAYPSGSSPSNFTQAGPVAFFWASDKTNGTELWVTDGTDAGTSLVVDLTPGESSTPATPMLALDAGVVLVRKGSRLYVSDGTAAGTRFRCCATSSIEGLAALPNGGVALDLGSDGLAVLDGSAEGATAVGTVSVSRFLGSLNGKLLLTGTDVGTSVTGLYATDGATVELLTPMFEWRTDFTVLAGFAYTFGRTSTGSTTAHLFRTDGTPGGTADLGTFSGGVSFPAVAGGNQVFFSGGLAATGTELYCASQPPVTFSLAADINAGAASGAPDDLVQFRGGVLFSAIDGAGREPWFVDGFDAGAVRLADAYTGTSGSFAENFTPNGPLALFTASGPRPLWVTDGTPAGTQPLSSGASASSSNVAPFGGGWLFSSDLAGDSNPWFSDGTAAGTREVRRIYRVSTYGSDPAGFTAAGLNVVMRATSENEAREPWRFDALDGGVDLIADNCLNYCNGVYATFGELGGRVYFAGRTVAEGAEVFSTSGNPGDVRVVQDLVMGSTGSDPQEGLVAGSFLYFTATTPTTGTELWRTDGTATGTVLAAEVNAGPDPSDPYLLVALPDGGVVFNASDSAGDVFLWRANPGALPTKLANDYAYEVAVLGDRVFAAPMCSAGAGCELWVSDGTAAGTKLFADVLAGSASSNPAGLAVQGNRLFFTANDGTNDVLFVTNPALTGVTPVFTLGPSGSYFSFLFPGANGVFFTLRRADSGDEPWFTDGTDTRLLGDLWPGPDGSDPDEFTAAGGRTFFAAGDPVHGRELWVSDGTAAGTVLAADVLPGPASSSPHRLTSLLGWLFFSASDELGDDEPWALPLTTEPPRITAQVTGQTGGDGGWYVSDVTVSFTVTDPSVPILTRSGCGLSHQPVDGGFTGRVVVTDDGDLTLPCAARTSGGERSTSVFIRRDAHAPTLACPDDVAADAAGPGGAAVGFTVPAASDAVDPSPAVSVDHAPGSTFPVGHTVVTVTATDHVGNTNTCRFAVDVRDGEAPSLSCPMDVTVEATSAEGAAVDYAAMVTDAIDPMPKLTYSAPPGTVFPPGRSGVSVLAIDASGNPASCSFTVTVEGLADAGMGGPVSGGCGCSSSPLPGALLLGLALLGLRRRRA